MRTFSRLGNVADDITLYLYWPLFVCYDDRSLQRKLKRLLCNTLLLKRLWLLECQTQMAVTAYHELLSF